MTMELEYYRVTRKVGKTVEIKKLFKYPKSVSAMLDEFLEDPESSEFHVTIAKLPRTGNVLRQVEDEE